MSHSDPFLESSVPRRPPPEWGQAKADEVARATDDGRTKRELPSDSPVAVDTSDEGR